MTRTGDDGFLALGWLTRLCLVLSLLGLVGFDGVALVQASFNASDHADSAASVAADTYKSTRDVQRSYDAAVASVEADGDTIEAPTFAVSADGHVSLTLHRTATTLWLGRIGPLEHFAHVTATGTGAPPS